MNNCFPPIFFFTFCNVYSIMQKLFIVTVLNTRVTIEIQTVINTVERIAYLGHFISSVIYSIDKLSIFFRRKSQRIYVVQPSLPTRVALYHPFRQDIWGHEQERSFCQGKNSYENNKFTKQCISHKSKLFNE